MSDNNSLSHTKWNCKYHIVFAPKFRRKMAYGRLKQRYVLIMYTCKYEIKSRCTRMRKERSRKKRATLIWRENKVCF